ncbi:flagellar filament capping protein FliD [Ideonella sp. A 288]|uniref:flagellar filament capping protein FliD n=1 Tax=Ideonella sp. A 288 TaxID=1962181 RepID=UPI000B4ACA67|nr:flagellar filament capping protein FliD [Ideonella sp. A 288]
MVSSISNVGTISSAGLGSGLDVSGIVTQLMALERRPLQLLESQATNLNTKLSTYGKLQSYFSALRDKSNDLVSSTLWSATVAASTDAAAVKVSTGTNAATGSYAVEVQKLAKGQTITTGTALANKDATLNEGTLTIELGAWTGLAAPDEFAPKSGSAPVAIAIGAGETSLAKIRDKINGAGAGVVASIITDASGARLSLRSKDTGAENAFRVSVTETADDGVAGTGLSALAYDATVPASPMTRSQLAINAEATVNGIPVSSAGNTLNNVVDGLTISLLKETTAPVDVTVSADSAAIKQKLTDFVAAFNDLSGFLRTQMAYNADSKTGGILQGDQSVMSLQRQLRDVLNQASTASGTWTRLSEVGMSLKADGSMELSATKLDNALGNLPELKKLLATDGADNASSGFMRRWKRLADTSLGSGGTFETRKEGINANLSRNAKTQDGMTLRLAQTEARLRAQYSTLDTRMATLNGLSGYLTQQITAFNNNNGN